jgi:hypothetical protein
MVPRQLFHEQISAFGVRRLQWRRPGSSQLVVERGSARLSAAACPYAVGVGVRSRKTLRAANGGGLIGPDFRAYFAGTAYRGF